MIGITRATLGLILNKCASSCENDDGKIDSAIQHSSIPRTTVFLPESAQMNSTNDEDVR